jgi:hypothetical protein
VDADEFGEHGSGVASGHGKFKVPSSNLTVEFTCVNFEP